MNICLGNLKFSYLFLWGSLICLQLKMEITTNTCNPGLGATLDTMDTHKTITVIEREISEAEVDKPILEQPCNGTTTTITGNPSKVDRSLRKRRTVETVLDGEEEADQEFTWDEYLEESRSVAVPPTAFLHVEYSLESGIKVGMVLEVPNREENDSYWQAAVVMNCGPLLSLRYLGFGDDRSNDFWWNISTSDSHPIGWCSKNDKRIKPPESVLKNHPDFLSLLTHNLEPVPEYLLDGKNSNIPIDQIKTDMKIEVLEELNPSRVWVATIIDNVGGRLQLRYLCDQSGIKDFWLFYLSSRVHPIGWAKESEPKLFYEPPEGIKSQHSEEEWKSLKENLLLVSEEHPTLSPDIIQPQETIGNHNFEVGMKLEMVHPVGRQFLYPATVTKIVNLHFFLVEIDDFRTDKGSPSVICCHAATSTIFPVKWSHENGVKIRYPRGYLDNPGNKEFDWDEYLVFCNGKAAPAELFLESSINTGFEVNAKLEAANPFQPIQICAATIMRLTEPLLWLQLEGIDSSYNPIIFPLNSQDIFPVGWCESNNYPLKPPRFSYSKRQRKILRKMGNSTAEALNFSNSQIDSTLSLKENSKSWCSKIYFNHKCFSGPFLSKNRLAQLPRHIGPGPVALVMKEVLSSLINVAYISSRVLRVLQLRGKLDPNMNQEILKAKWKGKSYRAVVEVVRKSEQVEEFCKEICCKIDCCAYLFGPKFIENTCPDQCHNMSKSKCSQGSLVKKRKAHKPNGGRKSPGAKKGNPKFNYPVADEAKGAYSVEDSSKVDKGETVVTELLEKLNAKETGTKSDDKKPVKSKFKGFNLPKSSMVTRGAKIPNFSLEMKWRRQRVRKLTSPPMSPATPRRGRPPLCETVTKNCLDSDDSKSDSSDTDDDNPKVIEISPSNVIRMSNPHWIRSNEQDLVKKLLTLPKQIKRPIPRVLLPSNPVKWTVDEVVNFVQSTDCAPIAPALKKEEIDGQALLLMSLPTAQEFLHLKYAPAVKFCHLVEVIKMAFYLQFANLKADEA